jgi:DNA-binding SARP family transcriptional activator
MNVADNGGGGGGGVQIGMLGGFDFSSDGTPIALPLGAQRLLAFLALHGDAHRAAAAERLWPDSVPARAAANLRSALWRGRRAGSVTVIDSIGPRLRLSPQCHVDLVDCQRRAAQIADSLNRSAVDDVADMIDGLSRELLPGWSEDWVTLARERWNHVRLHTLERLARKLLDAERYLPALETAMAAISIEPIRETAHRAVIEIHTAEGNVASALRHYHRYRVLLHRELGVAPSPRMAELAQSLLGR